MDSNTTVPFFSIIIPTYNRAHLISEAIRSVLDQTSPDWELLVCDDASTDHTAEVMREHSDPRIRYFRLPSNGGNAAARNLGLKNSRGQWITFLDSDDKYHPTYLEAFKNHISSQRNCSFFYCGSETVVNDVVKNQTIWSPVAKRRGHFLRELRIGIGCGVVVHRSCFDAVGGFDEGLRVSVDTDFLIRLEKKYEFSVLPKILVSVNMHSGPRVRNDTRKLMQAYQIMIEKNKSEIDSDAVLSARWYYKYMWLQYHCGEIKSGNKTYRELLARGLVTAKIRLVNTLFNLLPTSLAVKIHKRLSS